MSSSASRSSLMTLPHRRCSRPIHTIRTPQEFRVSRWRRSTEREKPMRKRTSSGERFQFSVENA